MHRGSFGCFTTYGLALRAAEVRKGAYYAWWLSSMRACVKARAWSDRSVVAIAPLSFSQAGRMHAAAATCNT
jgi:hypothetical protein